MSFSNFPGPGAYLIVPVGNKQLSVNLEGAAEAAGTPIIIWNKEPVTNNTIWQFDENRQGEYNIISRASGLMIKDTGNQSSGVICDQSDPEATNVLWRVVPVQGEHGHFQIDNVNGQTQLNVDGSDFAPNTKVLAWKSESGLNTKFFLIRASTS